MLGLGIQPVGVRMDKHVTAAVHKAKVYRKFIFIYVETKLHTDQKLSVFQLEKGH